MRAATLTPMGSAGAYLARLPVDGGLPRSAGGSAPTSDTFEACSVFARAAARMARWPPTGAVSRSASDHSSPPDPLRVLPAGARVAGWDLHPRNQCTFARHTAERHRSASLARRRPRLDRRPQDHPDRRAATLALRRSRSVTVANGAAPDGANRTLSSELMSAKIAKALRHAGSLAPSCFQAASTGEMEAGAPNHNSS
jgi:hypothetical protein